MAVIVKDRIEKIYEFDLRTFYQPVISLRAKSDEVRIDPKCG
jgi:hypothetical protein